MMINSHTVISETDEMREEMYSKNSNIIRTIFTNNRGRQLRCI